MADFSPIAVTSQTWTALPAAPSDHILQCRGGPVLLTRHSAPSGDNGIILRDGHAISVKTGDIWAYRLMGSVGASIIRA